MSNHHTLLHRILFNPTYAAALEIQDHALTLAHAQPGKETLTTLHEHPLPPGLVENGEVVDEREFTTELVKAIRESRIKNTYYVTHPPTQQTAIRLLTFPPMPAKELKSAVRYEAGKNLPFPLTDAAISFATLDKPKKRKSRARPAFKLTRHKRTTEQPDSAPQEDQNAPTPSDNQKRGRGSAAQPRSLLVAATPQAHVLKLMRIAKAAGIRLGVIEPRPLATLRALTQHDLIEPNEMVLDIDENYTSLTVVINDAVHLARSLPYGAAALAAGDTNTSDNFHRDIIATLEYVARFSENLQLQRVTVTGGTLHPRLNTTLDSLSLAPRTPPTLENVGERALPAYGLALRGARGV